MRLCLVSLVRLLSAVGAPDQEAAKAVSVTKQAELLGINLFPDSSILGRPQHCSIGEWDNELVVALYYTQSSNSKWEVRISSFTRVLTTSFSKQSYSMKTRSGRASSSFIPRIVAP